MYLTDSDTLDPYVRSSCVSVCIPCHACSRCWCTCTLHLQHVHLRELHARFRCSTCISQKVHVHFCCSTCTSHQVHVHLPVYARALTRLLHVHFSKVHVHLSYSTCHGTCTSFNCTCTSELLHVHFRKVHVLFHKCTCSSF